MTKRPKSGGTNVFVDTFQVAKDIQHNYPDTYEFFKKFPVEAEYIYKDKDGNLKDHFINTDFIFKHHPVSGELQQVRFNYYDRAVHRMNLEEQRQFYKHFRLLSGMMMDGKYAAEIDLQPGTVLFVDNWRVMHGRKAFEGGDRELYTGYVNRDEFISAARVLGLVV